MRHLRRYNESKKDKPNFKNYLIDGFVVYLGKDAESNDYVTLELGNDDEDIFLHAKGVPGSHVIIKVKDKIPSEEVIKKAATMAAKNSKSKEDKVKVVYCKKKFVKKEKGSAPGKVQLDYINANEIIVDK